MTQCNGIATEEWRPVVGYEGYYLVSNTGKIFSIRRATELFQFKNKGGYPQVEFWVKNKGCRKRVHAVVAEAFIGPRPDKLHVNHIDGNKDNNCPSNLEYVTQAENNRHAFRLGLNRHNTHNLNKTNNEHLKKVSDKEARELIALRGHVSVTELARKYGLDTSQVSRIQRGLRRPALSQS